MPRTWCRVRHSRRGSGTERHGSGPGGPPPGAPRSRRGRPIGGGVPSDPSRGVNMPPIVIVGVQWGDEVKGKATDLLGDRTDWLVKFNGGNNAGFRVVIGDEPSAL